MFYVLTADRIQSTDRPTCKQQQRRQPGRQERKMKNKASRADRTRTRALALDCFFFFFVVVVVLLCMALSSRLGLGRWLPQCLICGGLAHISMSVFSRRVSCLIQLALQCLCGLRSSQGSHHLTQPSLFRISDRIQSKAAGTMAAAAVWLCSRARLAVNRSSRRRDSLRSPHHLCVRQPHKSPDPRPH